MDPTVVEASFPIKRTNPRFSFFAKVEVALGDRTLVPAQLSELSSRGCYIQALEPIPVGTGLLLRIGSGMGTCELRGKVIYIHSRNGLGLFGMGVLFGKMSAEQRSTIDAWLHELAGKHATPTGSPKRKHPSATD